VFRRLCRPEDEVVKNLLEQIRFYLDSKKSSSKIIEHVKKQPRLLLLAITNFLPWEIVGIKPKDMARKWGIRGRFLQNLNINN